jgi:hypothetical protein
VFDFQNLGKMLLILGAVIAGVGGVLLLAGRISFLGHLPGDFHFQRGNIGCYIPLASSIIVSLILTVLLNLLARLLK